MEKLDRKKHWENIYKNKRLNKATWYESTPETSLRFLNELNLSKKAKIIDIGGGDSLLVDNLLDLGYKNITVLDISEEAINTAKKRLGNKTTNVKWIVSDVLTFEPTEKYDFWHDRAAFHFLTEKHEIENYVDIVQQNTNSESLLVLGTFSKEGPKKCSGIEIKQYSETSMEELLKRFFIKKKCFTIDHKTPRDTFQNFIFCSFKRLD